LSVERLRARILPVVRRAHTAAPVRIYHNRPMRKAP